MTQNHCHMNCCDGFHGTHHMSGYRINILLNYCDHFIFFCPLIDMYQTYSGCFIPAALEDVLGSSEEGEGLEETVGGDTDRRSGERIPWLSISSWVADWMSPLVSLRAVSETSLSKPRYNNCRDTRSRVSQMTQSLQSWRGPNWAGSGGTCWVRGGVTCWSFCGLTTSVLLLLEKADWLESRRIWTHDTQMLWLLLLRGWTFLLFVCINSISNVDMFSWWLVVRIFQLC